MPLRFLQYVSREYEKTMDRNAIYRNKQVRLPSPHFVVFYNGSKEQPERQELFLSDAYEVTDQNPNLELRVLAFNINKGSNQKLLEQCQTLKEYMQYVERVRDYVTQMDLEQAVDRAIQECIQEGILLEFLRKNRAEAKQMSIFEYHEEEVLKLIRKDEREEGELLKLIKLVCKKLTKGQEINEIAAFTAPNYDVESICKQFLKSPSI